MERMIKSLAAEYCKLQRLSERMPADTAHTIALRHSLRRLRAELDAHDVAFLDLTGQTYDAGMALEILDTDDPDGAHDGKRHFNRSTNSGSRSTNPTIECPSLFSRSIGDPSSLEQT